MTGPHLLLAVCTGSHRGTKLALPPGTTVTVGRSDLAELTLPNDAQLSTRHFSLQWQGSVATVRDLSSATGTAVDGERVITAEVRHGSWVRAGETDFTIHVEAHTPAPLEARPDDLDNLFGLPPADHDNPAFVTAGESREVMAFDERLAVLQEEQRLLAVLDAERRLAMRARARRDASALRAAELLKPIADGGRLHVVLDAARSDRILQVLREAVEEHRSLYEGVKGQALDDVAPYLVTLPADSRLLGQLVEEGWLRRWGIFLEGAVPKRELRRHLRRFLMVEGDAGEPLYFRFYDPVCLREFWPTCGARQRNELCGPLSAFLVEGEHGDLLRLNADGTIVAVGNENHGKVP
jgi:hypothetical protein